MANPTSNFGWQMPQNTDLVKDLPADFEVFGQAVDTSLMDLKGGTTGQVLSKASNTDMDFTWSSVDPLTILDAKGDLISATAADTPARLASSAVNGDVLTVDTSTATGLKWAAPASTGVTWTQRLAPTGVTFNRVAYNGSNLYVAVGSSGQLYTSSNGTSWTSRTSGFGANAIQDIAFGNGLWVAVGNNGTLTTSTDGTTWTSRTANMSTNTINRVIYENSIWVAVGDGGGSTNTGGITYSTDGITWTRKSQTPTIGANYYDIAWNGTNFVIAAQISTNNYLYASTPSGTWTAGLAGASSTLRWIYWDGTRHIFGNNSTTFYYSTSTTLASPTSYQNTMDGATNRIFTYYYNSKLYFCYSYLFSFSPASASYIADNKMISMNPCNGFKQNTTGFAENPGGIWVGSAGYIIVSASGEIFTSF